MFLTQGWWCLLTALWDLLSSPPSCPAVHLHPVLQPPGCCFRLIFLECYLCVQSLGVRQKIEGIFFWGGLGKLLPRFEFGFADFFPWGLSHFGSLRLLSPVGLAFCLGSVPLCKYLGNDLREATGKWIFSICLLSLALGLVYITDAPVLPNSLLYIYFFHLIYLSILIFSGWLIQYELHCHDQEQNSLHFLKLVFGDCNSIFSL